MAYTNTTATRTQDTDGTLKTFRLKEKDDEVYQVVVPADTDGTPGNSGASLTEAATAVASASDVYEIRCCLDVSASADYWFCLVNKAAAPATSDTIVDSVRVKVGGTSTLTFPGGRDMTTGTAVCISTTLTTVTLPGENVAKFFWNVD